MSQDTIDYPKGLTFEKVWATIQENHLKFLEEFQERDKKIQEEFQERDKKIQEEFQERDKKIQDDLDKYNAIFDREAEERQEQQKQRQIEDEKSRQKMEELGEYIKETSRIIHESIHESIQESSRAFDEKMSKLGIQVGELGNRFGELAEHLVAPNIVERFNELGYNFDRVAPNGIEMKKDGQVLTEVDLWLENTKTIAVVEVKSKPTTQDVNKHLKRMQIVRQNVEQHGDAHKSLIGAIAGAIFPSNVKQFAIETGFYVITQSGDTVKIEVPKDFKPRIF